MGVQKSSAAVADNAKTKTKVSCTRRRSALVLPLARVGASCTTHRSVTDLLISLLFPCHVIVDVVDAGVVVVGVP